MLKRFTLLVFFTVLFAAGNFMTAQEAPLFYDDVLSGDARWYRSNSSGLAIELISSRFAALRNEYCLSVERKNHWELPAILTPFYDSSFLIELRTLFENGGEYRRQWIFRGSNGTVRLTASGNNEFFSDAIPDEISMAGDEDGEKRIGFIEIMNPDGALTREIRYEEDSSEWEFLFFYNENTLLKADTLFMAPWESLEEEPAFVPVSTDYYRYTRAGSLRAIDRILHEGAGTASRSVYPRLGPDVPYDEGLSVRGMSYDSEFLSDIMKQEDLSISYTLDSRGRITSEVWKDNDGVILGELRNDWSGDRLQLVLWKSPDEERRVEYEYDSDGNRVAERNYRQGALERNVSMMGDREVEEIYMNGKLILRAFWEKGLKVSEERISRQSITPRELQ